MHSMIERGKFGFELALKNQRLFGKLKYKVIRYEDLVADTKSIMEDVCKFLEISFSERVLSPTIFGRPWGGNNYNAVRFKGAASSNVGRWKERITDHEAKLIEYHFEEFMKKFKYPVLFNLREKTRAAVEHYKWYNYAQMFSFESTSSTTIPRRKKKS